MGREGMETIELVGIQGLGFRVLDVGFRVRLGQGYPGTGGKGAHRAGRCIRSA
jgi:hypothetical protein